MHGLECVQKVLRSVRNPLMFGDTIRITLRIAFQIFVLKAGRFAVDVEHAGMLRAGFVHVPLLVLETSTHSPQTHKWN